MNFELLPYHGSPVGQHEGRPTEVNGQARSAAARGGDSVRGFTLPACEKVAEVLAK